MLTPAVSCHIHSGITLCVNIQYILRLYHLSQHAILLYCCWPYLAGYEALVEMAVHDPWERLVAYKYPSGCLTEAAVSLKHFRLDIKSLYKEHCHYVYVSV